MLLCATNLELESVRLVTLSQSESRTQEGAEKLNLANVGSQLGVDSNLSSLSGLRSDSGLLGSVKESLFALLDGLLLASEEVIINLRDINAIDRHLGGGGNDVSLVHAAQRNTVDAIWAYIITTDYRRMLKT
jgi:hypothetical protein